MYKENKNQTNRLQKLLKKIYHVHFCEKRMNQTRSKSCFNSSIKETKEILQDRVEENHL